MAVNVWSRFKDLLPGSPLIIVTVDSVNSDGTSTVSTAAGGSMRVLGTSVAAAHKAFVKNNEIIDEAPNLPHSDVEI